jgi:hypothetical protein
MASNPPLQQVTEQHGGKEKLVDKLLGLVDRGEEPKDELRARLLSASNTKLLRLYAVTTEIKEKFGGKDKLVDAILGLMKRTRDGDYRDKLMSLSPTRLIDLYRSRQKRSRAA